MFLLKMHQQIIRMTEVRVTKLSTTHSSREGRLHALLAVWHEPVLQEINKKTEEDVEIKRGCCILFRLLVW